VSRLLWSVTAVTVMIVALAWLRSAGRVPRTRRLVLEEVRRQLRGGAIERLPGRGPQARGRLGELEVTVDLHHDHQRRGESPMWRVMAVGPVPVVQPVEAHVAEWRGWIDPWMRTGQTLMVPAGIGPPFLVHARHALMLDHPVVVALRRQGPALVAGGIHVQRDFMRAEVRFGARPEENRGLFAFLQAMSEISSHQPDRSLGDSWSIRPPLSHRAG
jgi:hypothetical protein